MQTVKYLKQHDRGEQSTNLLWDKPYIQLTEESPYLTYRTV